MSDFDSDPVSFDPTLLFAQKCTKSAKSNPIFHLKGRKDKALVLTYLDPPMAEAFL